MGPLTNGCKPLRSSGLSHLFITPEPNRNPKSKTMKRTCLFLLLVVALLWPHSNMAQGPLPVQVNPAAAAKYVSEYPSRASAFIFEANGTVKCTDQGVLSAFNRYEKHMVPSPGDMSTVGTVNKVEAVQVAPNGKSRASGIQQEASNYTVDGLSPTTPSDEEAEKHSTKNQK